MRATTEVVLAALFGKVIEHWGHVPWAVQLMVYTTMPMMTIDLVATFWYDRVVERDDAEFPIMEASLARVVLLSIWIVVGVIIDSVFQLPSLFTLAAFYWAVRQSGGWALAQLTCVAIVWKQDVPDIARLASAWLCPRMAKKVKRHTLPRKHEAETKDA